MPLHPHALSLAASPRFCSASSSSRVAMREKSQRSLRLAQSKSRFVASMPLLPVASSCRTAALAGASAGRGGSVGRAQLEGLQSFHGLHFLACLTGHSTGNPIVFSFEAPMEQRQLPLLCRLDGPAVVPHQIVADCHTYRDAVRMSWALRRSRGMTRRTLAEVAGLYAPHVSCYLSDDDRKRALPGQHINAFAWAVGNTLVSQWLAWRDKLTVLEEVQAGRACA